MKTWKTTVPTYYEERIDTNEREFDSPEVPIVIQESAGIRIVLGTHEVEGVTKPDVQIERRPRGWAIFINPDGRETCAIIYVLDDSRTYCLSEKQVNCPLTIVDVPPTEIDERRRS
jgi:hypothetical protein